MTKHGPSVVSLACLLSLAGERAAGENPPLAAYFRAETARLAANPLGGIESAAEWKVRRPELQRQLREMLGLDPLPERGNLHATVTGTVERPEFFIEKLHFQSSPGLYVTANLYRPKANNTRLPAIVYVCGHSKVERDGVIYGNKAHYQHHAAWYAANGFVCLVLDTLQLGELPGLHHGTYRERMWWWQARGYTPAGVEAWNAIRAIDYLLSRPDVDPAKIGVTGRSGGGATSWWVGAIDDRVAAVVPVAGITDLQNHVVDGVIEGHCDCMYPVNTYRWDFPLVAALVAPKPLLVENTDKDPIFPEDGVRRVYAQLEKVYGWYGASDRLGLVIGKGGHVDSAEIRHPSFAFMNKWLRGKEGPIDEPDRAVPIEELKVLKPGDTPSDCRNATIHESFVPRVTRRTEFATSLELDQYRNKLLELLKDKVFRGWPTGPDVVPLACEVTCDKTTESARFVVRDFTSQEGIRLRFWTFLPKTSASSSRLTLVVMDQSAWEALGKPLKNAEVRGWDAKAVRDWEGGILDGRSDGVAFVAPRGVGEGTWPAEKDAHIRRRFALLGQTLDGMRVWDIRRTIAALAGTEEGKEASIELVGHNETGPVALFAAIDEPRVKSVTLIGAPASLHEGPTFLNQERILDMPEGPLLLFPRPVQFRPAIRLP